MFQVVVAEVRPDVSRFLRDNPQLVDELQFLAEITVHFREDKAAYFLEGSWHQVGILSSV